MMMSVTKSSSPSTGDCLTSGEGLHADTGSGCQVSPDVSDQYRGLNARGGEW